MDRDRADASLERAGSTPKFHIQGMESVLLSISLPPLSPVSLKPNDDFATGQHSGHRNPRTTTRPTLKVTMVCTSVCVRFSLEAHLVPGFHQLCPHLG